MDTTARTPVDPRQGPRQWGVVFAAIWLLYLIPPFEAGWADRDTTRGWLGMATTVVFGLFYLGVFIAMRVRRAPGSPFRAFDDLRVGWLAVGISTVLGVVMCVSLGQPGTAAFVYIGVMCVLCLSLRWGWVLSVLVAIGTYAATVWVPGWHRDESILFAVLVATLAVWGISQAINRSREVLMVREENVRLELADERNRFARDLHDILGHSLTVITVKAELANRLLDVDHDRARAELDDLERLSRDALADVRRAVEGYRELTLPGEIARARAALSAAEIVAELPNSTDEVPSEHRELFAWAVREGITNVIRHSQARRCQVLLSDVAVEIVDDGRGPTGGTPGHGLVGLRERAAQLDGSVVTRALDPGFSLKVVVR